MHLAGGGYNLMAYLESTPPRDLNTFSEVLNFGEGTLNVAPLPAKFFGFSEAH